MGKYIKNFNTHSEYETYLKSQDYIRPNISYCIQEGDVHFAKEPDIPILRVHYDINDSTPKYLNLFSLYDIAKSNYYNIDNLDFANPANMYKQCVGNMFKSITFPSIYGGLTITPNDIEYVSYNEFDTIILSSNISQYYGNVYVIEGRICVIVNDFSSFTEVDRPFVVEYLLNDPTKIHIGMFTSDDENISPIEYIKLPDTIETIEEYAFSGTAINKIKLNDGLKEICRSAFGYSTVQSINIPSSIESIDTTAFDINRGSLYTEYISNYCVYTNKDFKVLVDVSNKNQSTYNILPTTKIIADNTFYQCNALSSITIPSSVERIGSNVFSSSLLPTTNYIRYADTYAMTTTDNARSSYSFKSGTKFISGNVFNNCTAMTSITIPSSVIYLEPFFLYNSTNLSSITVNSENKTYDSRNSCNAIIETKTNTLITGCKNTTIPNTVKIIGDNAFRSISFTSITIPSNIKKIGEYAFDSCTSLTTVNLSEGLEYIMNDAFDYCENLQSITIPSTVKYIGNDVFYSCTSLTTATIQSNLKFLPVDMFCRCTNLTNVTLPNSITTILESAFENCSSLVSITLPSNLKNISYSAFSGCTSLTTINIPDTVTYIGDYAFGGCPLDTATANKISAINPTALESPGGPE